MSTDTDKIAAELRETVATFPRQKFVLTAKTSISTLLDEREADKADAMRLANDLQASLLEAGLLRMDLTNAEALMQEMAEALSVARDFVQIDEILDQIDAVIAKYEAQRGAK